MNILNIFKSIFAFYNNNHYIIMNIIYFIIIVEGFLLSKSKESKEYEVLRVCLIIILKLITFSRYYKMWTGFESIEMNYFHLTALAYKLYKNYKNYNRLASVKRFIIENLKEKPIKKNHSFILILKSNEINICNRVVIRSKLLIKVSHNKDKP